MFLLVLNKSVFVTLLQIQQNRKVYKVWSYWFSMEKNKKFNLPIYYVGVKGEEERSHLVNGVLVGNNPLDFNKWYFFDSVNEKEINFRGIPQESLKKYFNSLESNLELKPNFYKKEEKGGK